MAQRESVVSPEPETFDLKAIKSAAGIRYTKHDLAVAVFCSAITTLALCYVIALATR